MQNVLWYPTSWRTVSQWEPISFLLSSDTIQGADLTQSPYELSCQLLFPLGLCTYKITWNNLLLYMSKFWRLVALVCRSFFELLLFFGKDEFYEEPLKDILGSIQVITVIVHVFGEIGLYIPCHHVTDISQNDINKIERPLPCSLQSKCKVVK